MLTMKAREAVATMETLTIVILIDE